MAKRLILATNGTTAGTTLQDADTGATLLALPAIPAVSLWAGAENPSLSIAIRDSTVGAAPALPRPVPAPSGPELFTGSFGTSSGVTFDPANPTPNGSTPLAFAAVNGQANGRIDFPVTPGEAIVVTAKMKATDPGIFLFVTLTMHTSGGAFIENLPGSRFGVSAAGVWQECSFNFRIPADTGTQARVNFTRIPSPTETGTAWIGETSVRAGIAALSRPAAPRAAFQSSVCIIDGLGNWSVADGHGGYQPFFPLLVFENGATYSDYRFYKAQGFNGLMQGQSNATGGAAATALARAAAAGMYQFLEVSQYSSVGSRPFRLDLFQADLAALLADPNRAALLGFSRDFEEYTAADYANEQALFRAKNATLPQVPWLRIQSNFGVARSYQAWTDVQGTWATDPFSYPLAEGLEGMNKPVSVMKLLSGASNVSAQSLRLAAYRAIIDGAKGLYWYKDLIDQTTIPLNTTEAWAEWPALSREIGVMAPMLRQPHWTAWSATCSDPDLLIGTRDYAGKCWLLMANQNLTTPKTFTVNLSGIGPPLIAAVDAFTNTPRALVTNSSFQITLAAPGVGAGTACWYLL